MKNNIIFDGEKVKNKSLITKKVITIILIVWVIIISYIATYIYAYNRCEEKCKKELAEFKEETYFTIFESNDLLENPYATIPFLFNGNVISDEKATFIIKLSNALEINPDFCISILNTENPELNELAVSKKNKNGSVDLGMWQLNQNNFGDNSRAFNKIYWKFDETFDPYNWKHNTWIAIHHIKDLYDEFQDYEKVAQAYNGGASRVRKNSVVSMAKNYSERVMKTYNNLKNS